MVTDHERSLIQLLVRLKVFRLRMDMRCVNVIPRRGSRWILKWIKCRQVVDDLHHAPCCPANHWHRRRLVFSRCTCGAARYAAQEVRS